MTPIRVRKHDHDQFSPFPAYLSPERFDSGLVHDLGPLRSRLWKINIPH